MKHKESPPSHSIWRISILLSMFAGYSMYYVGRKSFTNVIPYLVEDKKIGLKKEDLGTIASVFMICYSGSKFVSGVLSDQISPRLLFCIGLFMSGVINCIFGLCSNVWIFTLLWCCNGIFQGFGWPPCTKLIKTWFRPTEAGTVWSLVSAASNVSASVTPFLAAALAVNFGWQSSFLSCGIICMLLSGFIFAVLHDKPSDVGLENQVNVNENKESQKSYYISANAFRLLQNPYLQLVGFAYMISSITKSAFEDWQQLYLIQTKGRGKYEASFAASSFQVGAFTGSILAGIMSDWCMRKFNTSTNGNPRFFVLLLMSVIMLCGAGSLHYLITDTTSNILLAVVSASLGCGSYGPQSLFGLVAVESAPPELSGTAHAIVAAMAGGGSVVAGYPFAYVFSQYGWDTALFCLECCTVLAIIVIVITMWFNSETSTHTKRD